MSALFSPSAYGFAALYSVAQPLTNALTTSSHEPVPAAYCVSAVPSPFFQVSDGMDEKFQLTDVLPSAIYAFEMATSGCLQPWLS